MEITLNKDPFYLYIGPEIEPCPCLEMHEEEAREKGLGDWFSRNKEQILYGAVCFIALSIFVHLNDVQSIAPIETKTLELPAPAEQPGVETKILELPAPAEQSGVETITSTQQLSIQPLQEASSDPSIEGSGRTQILIKGLAAKLFLI